MEARQLKGFKQQVKWATKKQTFAIAMAAKHKTTGKVEVSVGFAPTCDEAQAKREAMDVARMEFPESLFEGHIAQVMPASFAGLK